MDPKQLFNPLQLDLHKMMSEVRLPGVDYEALMASQQRNIQALTSAHQVAIEGLQAVGRRQGEITRQMVEETQRAFQEMMKGEGLGEAKLARQTELAKEVFERSIANMRELAEMIAKSNTEAFNLINKRFSDSLDELRQAIERKGK
jgi:phasin family protein